MKKDIEIRKVEDLAMALAPRLAHEEDADYFWDCYLFNLKEEPITSVLINSSGYGQIGDEHKKTASMRYYHEQVGPLEVVRVEQVPIPVLDLINQYWVSFQYDDYLYDKKYIFVQGSLDEANFIDLPFIGKRGVLIR